MQINQVSGKQEAEWRYKEGWGVFACADWFIGKCEGQPLEVAPPSGRDMDGDAAYNKWVKVRLRELWPIESTR
ncbi:MAG: hypothetical protein ABI980_15655 [Nitrospirota bacterium]